MLFTVEKGSGQINQLNDEPHTDLDILEREDLEEWVIRELSLQNPFGSIPHLLSQTPVV